MIQEAEQRIKQPGHIKKYLDDTVYEFLAFLQYDKYLAFLREFYSKFAFQIQTNSHEQPSDQNLPDWFARLHGL